MFSRIASLALLAFAPLAHAGYYATGSWYTSPDDGYWDVFAEAVEAYDGTNISKLNNAIDGADNFIDQLYAAGYTNQIFYTDSSAWSTDYEEAVYDDIYNDSADISLFSGHGISSAMLFNGSSGDNFATSAEMYWGDNDLEVIAMDACSVLDTNGMSLIGPANWGAGVHHIQGFHTVSVDTSTTSSKYGYYLRLGYSFISAWKMATAAGHSSSFEGGYIRYYTASCDTYWDSAYWTSCDPDYAYAWVVSHWTL